MSENATPDRQPLLRDRNHKMIAGVCTGLGHHLDIDPVIFRILFAVLAFFGGLGILAYAACWLLIPADGEQTSEAQRLLTGPNVYVAAGAAALMVLGLLWFTNILAIRFDHSLPIVLAGAAAIGVVVWHRENQGKSPGSDDRRDGPGGSAAPGSPFAQTQTWWQRPVPESSQPSAGERPAPEPFVAEPFVSEPVAESGPGTAHAAPSVGEPSAVPDTNREDVAAEGNHDLPAAISDPLEPADRIDSAASGAEAGQVDSDNADGAEEEL
jgi:phage shock protein PspC (stress-responsive transcriptional regulator)